MSKKFPKKSAIIIAIINNKGGVGKTATTVNLAHGLANKGMRVLVIDQDSQCNSTSSMLLSEPDRTLKEIYAGERDIASAIYPSKFEGVDILPNEQTSSALEPEMWADMNSSLRLYTDHVSPYTRDKYDYVLIDCPPTLGLWLLMALAGSDCAIVPVDAGSAYALDGLATAIRTINDIAETINPNLDFLRILINKADMRTSISRNITDYVHRTFGEDKVFTTSIPHNTAIQQADLSRTSVIRHSPGSVGTKRYRELADELIRVTGKRGATA